ncbi:uncharacterized protein LOC128317091 [Pangasianodon hypophthalmus]|uniref:uncharacterized protein LOC128317091 n=1 Tax=Pangasianodon hypophthalmus TaxID=310915 RepID=UPI0023073205|nr:uncharacterized protein LOC128317091 [Pangasianodon hypophthalmus]
MQPSTLRQCPFGRPPPGNIARELLHLFSHVSVAKDILTDQGMPFMSKLKADLCRLLQVKHLRMSVYHPQIRTVQPDAEEDAPEGGRRGRGELGSSPPLRPLRCLREPAGFCWFTPFELLYGRRSWGLLDVAQETWEEQPTPYRSLVDDVQEIQERIDKIMPIEREHMEHISQVFDGEEHPVLYTSRKLTPQRGSTPLWRGKPWPSNGPWMS